MSALFDYNFNRQTIDASRQTSYKSHTCLYTVYFYPEAKTQYESQYKHDQEKISALLKINSLYTPDITNLISRLQQPIAVPQKQIHILMT
jgi:hypothetical protein